MRSALRERIIQHSERVLMRSKAPCRRLRLLPHSLRGIQNAAHFTANYGRCSAFRSTALFGVTGGQPISIDVPYRIVQGSE